MSRRPAERRTQHAVMATASEWARIRELAAAEDMDLSRYIVVKRRRLTPRHPRESTRCRADRRPICALNNSGLASARLFRGNLPSPRPNEP